MRHDDWQLCPGHAHDKPSYSLQEGYALVRRTWGEGKGESVCQRRGRQLASFSISTEIVLILPLSASKKLMVEGKKYYTLGNGIINQNSPKRAIRRLEASFRASQIHFAIFFKINFACHFQPAPATH